MSQDFFQDGWRAYSSGASRAMPDEITLHSHLHDGDSLGFARLAWLKGYDAAGEDSRGREPFNLHRQLKSAAYSRFQLLYT